MAFLALFIHSGTLIREMVIHTLRVVFSLLLNPSRNILTATCKDEALGNSNLVRFTLKINHHDSLELTVIIT